MTEKTYALSELNAAVGRAIRGAFPEAVWVAGEVARFSEGLRGLEEGRRNGIFFQLVEKAETGEQARVSMEAVIWREDWTRLASAMARAQVNLQDGLQVRLRVEVSWWKTGRLVLKVVEVDPTFSLGQMALARRRLLEKLKKEGLLEKNRALPFPEVPLGIGLISAEGSAAIRDFLHTLQESGWAFRVVFVPCRMQGAATEPDVCAAISDLSRRPEVQAICLVRGGGSAADLAWFDREGISRAIANSPVPVLTGIGHEVDRSVADEVAWRAFKTPTACAEFLVRRVQIFWEEITDTAREIVRQAETMLEAASEDLAQAGRDLRRLGLRKLREERTGLVHAGRQAASAARRRLQRVLAGLAAAGREIRIRALHALSSTAERLKTAERIAGQLHPSRILARGFSILYDGGNGRRRAIKEANQVKRGDALEAVLYKGSLRARVV